MDWSPLQWIAASTDSRATTSVVATVLLVGLVVVVSASVGTAVLGVPGEVAPTDVAVDDAAQCNNSVEFDPENVDEFADRRSDCTAETDEGEGVVVSSTVLWYDASQEGFSASGESVGSWTDRSGNGHDATVLRGDPQGYAAIDGVPAVEFESTILGGGDVLSPDATTDEMNLDGDTAFSVSVVVHRDGLLGTYFGIGNFSRGTVTGQVASTGGPQNQWQLLNSTVDGGGVDHATTSSTVPQNGPWTVVTYTYNGSAVSLYVDGQRQDPDKYDDIEIDLQGSITVGGSTAGAFPEFDGAIAELVIYDRALSDAERTALECGFDDKYGSEVTVTGC